MNDTAHSTCGLAGWGVVRIPWADIPRWRKNPGPADGLTAMPNLKLADEQTVLAMAAVLHVCQKAAWAPTGFRDWGVLCAPKFMGRARLAHAIRRFKKQGVRGMSPLIIPTLSQHSVAGTLCLILGCHGPNFGIGGNSTSVAETLLNAMSMLKGQPCPGIWAVMTAWDPEPIPDGAGQTLEPTTGIGVALALTPDISAGAVRLLMPDALERIVSRNGSLIELADFLEQPGKESSWRLALCGGGALEIIPGMAVESSTSLPLRQAG